jgi:hypothetical protein
MECSKLDKIPVTEEMVKAGLRELSYYSRSEDGADFAAETVAAIYRAMCELRPKLMSE